MILLGKQRWWMGWGIAANACVAAYQPKGAASLAASYVNLATPGTNDAAPGTAPTWAAATGWTFNGTNQYLTTGITPTYTYSMIFRYLDDGKADLRGSLGAGSYGTYFLMRAKGAAGGMRMFAFGRHYYPGTKPYSAPGVMAIVGVSSSQGLGYLNGVLDETINTTWSGTPQPIYIGARNRDGPGMFGDGSILAVAIYSTTLTADQVKAVSVAMARL